MKHISCLLLLLLTTWTTQAYALSTCPHPESDRPKVALVLGGGGARGSAHIGVIQVLQELNIPVDYVVGTSIGSLVGGLFATGMNGEELEEVMTTINWDELFKDNTPRADLAARRKLNDTRGLYGPKFGIGKDSNLVSQGAISGQHISFLFEQLVKRRVQQTDFDALPIPFRAVAADIITGKPAVLATGNLPLAMRASMAVPGVFDPIEWDDYLLVDGGIANNVPVDVARDMGADMLIVVNVGSPLASEINSAVDIIAQLTGLLVSSNTGRQLATLTNDDLLITPDLNDKLSSADFNKAGEGIAIGYAAADAVREQLGAYSVSNAEYLAHRAVIEGCVSRPDRVDFVRLENESRLSDEVILNQLSVQPGDTWNGEQLNQELAMIYGLGGLEYARYEVVEENGASGLLLKVRQDTRGTQFIETGLEYYGIGSENSVNIRVGYLDTGLDELGSEFRVTTQLGKEPALKSDLYKYLDSKQRFFIRPALFAERLSISEFTDNGSRLSESRIDRYGGSFAAGIEIAKHAVLYAGVRHFDGSVESEVGISPVDSYDFSAGEANLGFLYDRLDDLFFPRSGELVRARYLQSQDWLGADSGDNYEQFLLDGMAARTFGRHTFQAGARYYITQDGEAPPFALFRAGGFERLSGLSDDELGGQNFGMALLGYRYRLTKSEMAFMPGYLGMTLEYGSITEERGDLFDDGLFNGSIYLGYESPIGPMFLGWGGAEGGRSQVFIKLGSTLSTGRFLN